LNDERVDDDEEKDLYDERYELLYPASAVKEKKSKKLKNDITALFNKRYIAYSLS